MDEPKIAQKSPYEQEVEEGKTYAWCRCGLSKAQPLCDGSHASTSMRPMIFKADKTETVWLCGCKNTKDEPYCDGTHSSL